MSGKNSQSKQMNLFKLVRKHQYSFIDNLLYLYTNPFRRILSECISKSSLSRYQICAKMGECMGMDVTVSMLNSWTAESHEQHRFPAEYLPAFCEAVGCYEPIAFLARRMGLFLMPGTEALRSEIQKLDEEIERLQEEKEKRVSFLSEANKEP